MAIRPRDHLTLGPTGSELSKTRLHGVLAGIEKRPVIFPVREMERPAAAPSPHALSRKERDSI